jgi:hypothetical protein
VNYNRYKEIENWLKEKFKKYSPFKKFIGFTINCKCYMVRCIFSRKKYSKKSKLNYKIQHIYTNEEDGVINLKSKIFISTKHIK